MNDEYISEETNIDTEENYENDNYTVSEQQEQEVLDFVVNGITTIMMDINNKVVKKEQGD